jgi:hypothetical protein
MDTEEVAELVDLIFYNRQVIDGLRIVRLLVPRCAT